MYFISFRFSSLWLGKVTARCMSASNTARLCCRGWSDLKFRVAENGRTQFTIFRTLNESIQKKVMDYRFRFPL